MNATEKQKHAQEVMQQFGFKQAGAEWLTALHKAQKKAKKIERRKGIPDKNQKIKFYVAPAEDFTEEGRRCLLPDDVGMGWFRVCTQAVELNAHMGTTKLTACYIVYHEPTTQAQVFYHDWVSQSGGDAMASAHTRVTRRFIQGLLQIAVVDEGIEPEDPPPVNGQQAAHPQERHLVNADTSVVCTLCGLILGYVPAGQAPPTQHAPPPQYAPPTAAPLNINPAPNPRPEPTPPAPSLTPPAAPAPTAPAPTNYATGPGYQQPLPPIEHSVVVQQAQEILGATPVSPQQMRTEQAEAPAQKAPVAGEPSSPEEWRDALVAQGMDPQNALQIAMLDDARAIEPELVEDMRQWSWSHYQGNVEKIQAAFQSVGFEPVPSLPIDQRPRPTGAQAKKFLIKMQFKSAAAQPAQ
jgi:hypothetical protein